jgi:glycosyltransferase involved in cell wall biosynthesis
MATREALRIAYDARMSLGQYRGMGRYLRALISGREDQLIGLCATGESDPKLGPLARGFRSYPLWEQLSLARRVREHHIDVLIAPYNTAPLWLPPSTRLILIVHDLIYMDPLPPSRSLYQNAGRLYRRMVTPRAVRRADLILTVSHYTANQLASRFGIAEERLRVIPVSLGEEWFEQAAEARSQVPFVLAVAGEAPSKNLARAIEAFAQLKKKTPTQPLRLKVAGVKPPFHAAFQQQALAHGIGNSVEFLSYVSDAQMRELYRSASLLLMPSLAEGFGIPVVEAMASSLPVVASRASSLPEVGGEAALYFDPLSPVEMAQAMRRVLLDAGLRAQMAERGRLQARRFHPQAVNGMIDAFWREIEAQPASTPVTEFASC